MEWKDFIPLPNSWLDWSKKPKENPYAYHANFLVNQWKQLARQKENQKNFGNDDLDWKDEDELVRKGFIDKSLAKIEKIEDPYAARKIYGRVYLPYRMSNGKIQYPASIAGHEFGHIKSNYNPTWEDFAIRYGTLDHSIESLTNGTEKTKAPILLEEEKAWNFVPKGYNTRIRDNALLNYRTGVALRWHRDAIKKMLDDGLVSEEEAENAFRDNVEIPDSMKRELSEFWRTNSFNNAINHLKKSK